jgi:hypothetical protein
MIVAAHTRLVPALLIQWAIGAAVLSFAYSAVAQSTPPAQLGVAPAAQPETAPVEPQVPALPPDVQPPPPSTPPGLFGAIGRWVDTSIGSVTSGFNSARDAVGGFGDQASEAAKGAADAASKVPVEGIFGRHQPAHSIRTEMSGLGLDRRREAGRKVRHRDLRDQRHVSVIER